MSRSNATPATRTAGLGCLSRRERWGLTIRGWLVAIFVIVAIVLVLGFQVHEFLAVNRPLKGDLLVIEGWIPEYALAVCQETFKENNYRQVITVGGPVGGADYPAALDDTYAWVAGKKLEKLGFDSSILQMVPTNARTRDRTFGSALAVREWLAEHHETVTNLTIATLGPHARRSRLLYQTAFGRNVNVGIISIDNREYDPKHWWRYSEGIREVISEASAYLYVRLFFRPDKQRDVK